MAVKDNQPICNSNNLPSSCSNLEICTCMHVLEVNLNDLVEMVFVDGGDLAETHPIHIHGYNYAIIGSEKVIQLL